MSESTVLLLMGIHFVSIFAIMCCGPISYLSHKSSVLQLSDFIIQTPRSEVSGPKGMEN